MKEEHAEAFGGEVARGERRHRHRAGDALAAVAVLPMMQRAAKTVTDDGAVAQVDALMCTVRGQGVHDTGFAAAEQHDGMTADVKAADSSAA